MEKTGRIIKSISGFYDVFDDESKEIIRTRARGNFRKRKIKPLVGDKVTFDATGDLGYILEILPRENSLVRPPIANIDQAIVVTSAAEPNFSSNLLDKILINIEHNGIEPVIYLTKSDLLNDEQYQTLKETLEGYHRAGYLVFDDRDSYNDQQVAKLEATFAGKVTVFTGQSGAGKSTLLNHIDTELGLATAAISQTLNRGKHTTRQVSLFDIADGLVADTPGFSSIDLMNVAPEELPTLFPEFLEYSPECQFRGCRHVNEPNCKVKEELAEGNIMQSRYDNYLYFLNEINSYKKRY
ncbi:ribosome small subunit-dependent GTPase A [Companilactobacillus kimchii]|uniref:Small ribosomal subunit biogenesis GTPase RsgA n=2 Tax=Companilactobacillus kimchii TaxID=2801452 RepID=A0ABR5NQD9_9LACO|nr:ribosome small subunit-dependent GTPase A [Companilactobacillus kimchii]KAE9562835.1 ribosome biogenesis GTPase RsgA [Companilactobacillus kimchii]KRK49868.1 GTP-binding protein [Companilactobacillus kimchii DSM 13961 = JCM 10707]OWF33165.1 putative ribosome bioproteinis GTPase RsgA [Companilactobacillus kimchii]GEO46750.1 putative ribosome biogenesis GTPase RsgA 1 [Companilactobacillus paralimentarius]